MDKTTAFSSEKSKFTRMCIGEALLSLMQDTPPDKITISDIAQKAGLSRMTYYRYYTSKTDALQDYLEEMIADYLLAQQNRPPQERFHDYTHILFSLEFFDRHAGFFLTMKRAGLYSIMIDAINRFMEKQLPPRYPNSEYELFYYAGALLNIFIKWEEDGKRLTAEEVAAIICQFVSRPDSSVQ